METTVSFEGILLDLGSFLSIIRSYLINSLLIGSNRIDAHNTIILDERFRTANPRLDCASSTWNNSIEKPLMIHENSTTCELTNVLESHLELWSSHGLEGNRIISEINNEKDHLIHEAFFELDDESVLDLTNPWSMGTFEILLVVDTREIRSKEDRTFIQQRLIENGVRCVSRSMELGDFVWIARRKDYPQGNLLETFDVGM